MDQLVTLEPQEATVVEFLLEGLSVGEHEIGCNGLSTSLIVSPPAALVLNARLVLIKQADGTWNITGTATEDS